LGWEAPPARRQGAVAVAFGILPVRGEGLTQIKMDDTDQSGSDFGGGSQHKETAGPSTALRFAQDDRLME
jgi:hypothetical protein